MPFRLRRLRCRWPVAACGCLSALLAGGTPARSQEVGYSVSLSGARATYPDQRLSGVYVFNSVDVTAGPVGIWVSVPFIRQWNTLGPLDPLTGAATSIDQTSDGFGDPLVRLDLRLLENPGRNVRLGISVSLKPALVDGSSGLGTGASDFGFGASVFKGQGRTSLFADLMFWKYGDPEGVDFQDTLAYSVGVGRVIGGGRWSSMVSLSGLSNGVAGTAAPLQLNVAALALAGRRQSIAFTAGIGLNDSASDFSAGTTWRTSF